MLRFIPTLMAGASFQFDAGLPGVQSSGVLHARSEGRQRGGSVPAAFAAVLLLTAAIPIVDVTLGGNFHTIVDGSFYRCAQPSAARLERLVQAYGIRTVINLR